MTRAQKVVKMAKKEGLHIFQARLTGLMDEATKSKFLGFSRWHFNTCSDSSKFKVLIKDGKVDQIEVYVNKSGIEKEVAA